MYGPSDPAGRGTQCEDFLEKPCSVAVMPPQQLCRGGAERHQVAQLGRFSDMSITNQKPFYNHLG